MNRLLKYLIVKTWTIDGKYGTALPVYDKMVSAAMKGKDQKWQKNNRQRIQNEMRVKLLQKVYTRYVIIRFRQKISFIAFQKKMTICELFLTAILQSFNELLADGRVSYKKNKRKSEENLFKVISKNTNMKGLFSALMLANQKSLAHKNLRAAIKLQMKKQIDEQQSNIEKFKVRINGKEKEKTIDKDKQGQALSILSKIQNKNKCDDIFKYTIVDEDKNLRMYQKMTQQQYAQMKIDRVKKQLIWNKIQTVKSLKCVNGILFIKLSLEQINISKQLFTTDIEQGSEAYIPKMLSQDQLPLSFRFYDPIIKIVQELMTEEKKNFFMLKG